MSARREPLLAGASSTDALRSGLASALGVSATDVVVRTRRQNTYSTSASGEIVLCSVRGQADAELFVKYETPSLFPSHGHRGGVAYEANVHERLLARLGVGTVRYMGSFETADGRFAAVYRWLSAAVRVSRSSDPLAMPAAAAWIGRLHRASEGRTTEGDPFLLRYGREYYAGWIARTIAFTADAEPWLDAVGRNALAEYAVFDDGLCVIHGEYYPQNVLVWRGRVYPVDWETAAIGPGEIDLAALTEGWSLDVTNRCVRAYAHARWHDATPEDFPRRLDLARIYLSFRWLGDRPAWSVDARSAGRYEELRRLGGRLGLLDCRHTSAHGGNCS